MTMYHQPARRLFSGMTYTARYARLRQQLAYRRRDLAGLLEPYTVKPTAAPSIPAQRGPEDGNAVDARFAGQWIAHRGTLTP